MKFKMLLFVCAAATLGSCSTVYKSGQTPDDVYYSPARAAEETVNHKTEVRTTDYEERQIRMSSRDARWRTIDRDYDYDYSYSPYRYGYDYGYYYNPYYYPCPVYIKGVAITNPRNTTPRMANLRTYANTNTVITNQKTMGTYQVNSRHAYSNSNSSAGTFVRRVLTTAQRNSTYSPSQDNSSSNNTRSYSPASSTRNSSSTNNSSSSGSVARPSRGN